MNKLAIKSLLRNLSLTVRRFSGLLCSIPFRLRDDGVAEAKHVAHSTCVQYLSDHFDKEEFRVLEIGAREVTGANLRNRFTRAEYVGFDFYPGDNVDVVGDVHRLSSYFVGAEKFDLIFSFAVMEHLHMPWVAAVEMQKMLKVGGFVFVETHFSFSSHERPWHFFQFSDMGLRALFNDSLGFELIDKGMSNPLVGYFSHRADRYLRYLPVRELYCHSEILCRKTKEVEGFIWAEVEMDGIVDGSRYPRSSKGPAKGEPEAVVPAREHERVDE